MRSAAVPAADGRIGDGGEMGGVDVWDEETRGGGIGVMLKYPTGGRAPAATPCCDGVP